MKARFIIAVPLFMLLLHSCGNVSPKDGTPKEVLKKQIAQLERVITSNSSQQNKIGQQQKESDSLVQLLLNYYHTFPNDPQAAVCLDKVHLCYSAAGDYLKAANYADTLLKKYPHYINRPLVLESQGSAYDIFIQPRDISKVRYYYGLLLKENPQLEKEKRKEIENRLKTIETPFEELIP
jgi:hypothetical protein